MCRVSKLIQRGQTEPEGIKVCVYERMFMYMVSLEHPVIQGGNRNPASSCCHDYFCPCPGMGEWGGLFNDLVVHLISTCLKPEEGLFVCFFYLTINNYNLTLKWYFFYMFMCVWCACTCPTPVIDRRTPVTPQTIIFILSSKLYQVLNTRHCISDGVKALAFYLLYQDWQTVFYCFRA